MVTIVDGSHCADMALINRPDDRDTKTMLAAPAEKDAIIESWFAEFELITEYIKIATSTIDPFQNKPAVSKQ